MHRLGTARCKVHVAGMHDVSMHGAVADAACRTLVTTLQTSAAYTCAGHRLMTLHNIGAWRWLPNQIGTT